MRVIRELDSADFDAFITLSANAYPGIRVVSEEDRNRFRGRLQTMNEDTNTRLYGLFESDQLLGGMRFHDFTMNLLSTKTLIGGVGGVAVDLLRKKEKVARDMLVYFLRYYQEKGACLTALYPFRPDFYKKMGFGYGTKLNHYQVRASGLPQGPSKKNVVFLSESDKEALRDCYARLFDKTHGLIQKPTYVLNAIFNDPANKIAGYRQDGRVSGYVIFTFQPAAQGNFLRNNIVVREFVYETSEALWELLTFLRSQLDQIDYIVLNTQDENFHYLLQDPRNQTGNLLPSIYHESNTQGIGIMYRVIDVKQLFAVLRDHNFGSQTCRLKLTLADSFYPQNAGSTIIHFTDGRPALATTEDYDVELSLDVSDFSSLVMGAVSFRPLHRYGLAQISDLSYVDTVDRLFQVVQKPLCLTSF